MANDPLKTKLTDMLGIEFPIVAFTHCKDVVDAVVNAGRPLAQSGDPQSARADQAGDHRPPHA